MANIYLPGLFRKWDTIFIEYSDKSEFCSCIFSWGIINFSFRCTIYDSIFVYIAKLSPQ